MVCDADQTDRLAEWQRACEQAGLTWPGDREPVALFFPNREIENWIYYLRGKGADEAEKRDKLARAGDCQDAVDALAAICRGPGGPPEDTPPSLRQACKEYARFRAAAREG